MPVWEVVAKVLVRVEADTQSEAEDAVGALLYGTDVHDDDSIKVQIVDINDSHEVRS